MQNLVVVCADVGSVAKGNFGWWSNREESGTRPLTLAHHVATMLNSGFPVALGLECPLFVPLVEDECMLTSARPGERTRAWSAGAGCGALATGIVQTAWLPQRFDAEQLGGHLRFCLGPRLSNLVLGCYCGRRS